jgi:hypothetical protein
MKRATSDECWEDNINGLKARCRNYFLETRADVADGTLGESTVDQSIIYRFTLRGYAYEVATNFVQALRSEYDGTITS